jgi:hypothetical protein
MGRGNPPQMNRNYSMVRIPAKNLDVVHDGASTALTAVPSEFSADEFSGGIALGNCLR